jgi:CheY-like chemotaxis protein
MELTKMNIKNIPLLPALVKRAKDAARAVKDGVHVAVHQVTDNLLTKLLDLPYFAVTGYAIEPDRSDTIVHLFCHLTLDVGICPHCQAVSSQIKQYKDRCVRDHDIWGKRTFLHFQIRRFDCPACGLRFTEELATIGWRRRQTKRFEQAVYQQCLRSSKKETAEQFQLSQTTVAGIFQYWAKRQQRAAADRPAVRVLGIDEIALKKRHKQYALVLSDLERHCVLAILPTREQTTLIDYIYFLGWDNMLSILLVEDYLPVSSLVVQFLEVNGNTTVKAVSRAEEALAHLESIDENEFPDVILIDLSLPGMNGLQLMKILLEKYPQILCIVLSGYKHVALINEALDAGARGYVLKDHAHQLEQAIQHVLNGEVYTSIMPPN